MIITSFWFLRYLDYWCDVTIITPLLHKYHNIITGIGIMVQIVSVTWNKRGCQLITTYLILPCDICRWLACCNHCWNSIIGVTASVPASAEKKWGCQLIKFVRFWCVTSVYIQHGVTIISRITVSATLCYCWH